MAVNSIFDQKINIEIKKVVSNKVVIKNELKYIPMSKCNTCIAEPDLKLLPLISFSKGLL